MKVQYIVACDECPGIVEEDSITFSDRDRNAHEIAEYLATEYLHQNLYDWEDDFHASELFQITAHLDNGIFVVEFVDDSPFRGNFPNPDHTINVQILSIA